MPEHVLILPITHYPAGSQLPDEVWAEVELYKKSLVECFRKGEEPLETFADGVAVMEILMGLYLSSETGNTVRFPNPDLENYVPVVARR